MNIKITIANKQVEYKPQTPEEKDKYFSGLKFKTGNFDISTFKQLIEKGYTITYLYKDNEFERKSGYMKNNYKGTQFLVVDIDKCDKSPKEFVESIKFKPTIYHTTFSNLTEKKDNKYCFHLIYVFDETIYGESEFTDLFGKLTDDYKDYVDSAAKDCHRVIFTSNSSLSGFTLFYSDNVYKLSDFIDSNTDSLDNFFTDSTASKIDSSYISTLTNNMEVKSKNEAPKEIKNDWILNDDFFTDYNTMKRSDFIDKYESTYPYLTSTPVKFNENGFADISDVDYYEIDGLWRFEEGKAIHKHIENGKRTSNLLYRGRVFLKMIPNITKEWFLTVMVKDVYMNYDNSDKELNNYKIYDVCKYLWNDKDFSNVNPTKKNIKVNTGFWAKKGYTPMEAVGITKRLSKIDKILDCYDFSISLEDNIKALESLGIKTSKKYIINLFDSLDIEYFTNKDKVKEEVIRLFNNGLSEREIEKEMKNNNYSISDSTIHRIISASKNESTYISTLTNNMEEELDFEAPEIDDTFTPSIKPNMNFDIMKESTTTNDIILNTEEIEPDYSKATLNNNIDWEISDFDWKPDMNKYKLNI